MSSQSEEAINRIHQILQDRKKKDGQNDEKPVSNKDNLLEKYLTGGQDQADNTKKRRQLKKRMRLLLSLNRHRKSHRMKSPKLLYQ